MQKYTESAHHQYVHTAPLTAMKMRCCQTSCIVISALLCTPLSVCLSVYPTLNVSLCMISISADSRQRASTTQRVFDD